jgi:hypothetical protein
MRSTVSSVLLAALLAAGCGPGDQPQAAKPAAKPDDRQAEVERLQAQVKELQGLVPDQAAVMTHAGGRVVGRVSWAGIAGPPGRPAR